MKKQNAFTLAEIFIAMVILSVLVSVCITFFVKRHDYEREYFSYTAYRNIVNVVDAALMNEQYLLGTSAKTENTTCGTAANLKNCRAFKTGTSICEIFKDYFNTVSDSCGTVTTNPATSTTPALKLPNGMEFFFADATTSPFTSADTNSKTLFAAGMADPENSGTHFWVDINGHGQGEDKLNYDIFEYYLTRSGKVVPVYGSVSGIRGYEYIPADMDGGANRDIMVFDVIYNPQEDGVSPKNHYLVIDDAHRSVPFPIAACASGFIPDTSGFCQKFKYNCNANGTSCTEGVTKAAVCTNDYADCKPRLVKKLRRLK